MVAVDPMLELCNAARRAEKAADAAVRLHGGDVPPAALNAADAALSAAYSATPTSLASIAALAHLVLDVEFPDPEFADALRSIERAALALAH